MNGAVVLVFVLSIAFLLVAAFLIGTAEFEETLAQWRADRDVRDGVDEFDQRRRNLAPTSQWDVR